MTFGVCRIKLSKGIQVGAIDEGLTCRTPRPFTITNLHLRNKGLKYFSSTFSIFNLS